MTALFTAPAADHDVEPEPQLFLMVWDVGSCRGRVAPAVVERRCNGIVRLRVGGEVLLLGEDDVAERQRRAEEARLWDVRERARQGGTRG